MNFWQVYVDNGRDEWVPVITFTTPTQARQYSEREYLGTEPGTPSGSMEWRTRDHAMFLYEDGEWAGVKIAREGDDA